jgi:hypothetical protein
VRRIWQFTISSLILGVWVLSGAGCSTLFRAQPQAETGFIKVAADNWTFVDAGTGKTFIPFGVNYCSWQDTDDEQIRADFVRMNKLGVNIVRVNIPAWSDWVERPEPGQFVYDSNGLAKFDLLIDAAKQQGIRLILCQWLFGYPRRLGDIYANDEVIDYQVFGYERLAEKLKEEPTIFAYTLMNEPRNTWDSPDRCEKWNTWLKDKYGTLDAVKAAWGDVKPEETWGDIEIPPNEHVPGSQRLYDYQLFGRHIARKWTEHMVAAIRKHDASHLIGLGAVQWSVPFDRLDYPGGFNGYTGFDPRYLADLLDFTCMHYYPFSWHHPVPLDWETINDPNIVEDWLHSAEAFHYYAYIGKPVIFEEFNFGLTPRGKEVFDPEVWRMVAKWNEKEINHTRTCVSGWLSWPYRDRPDSRDITNAGGLVDPNDNIKPWGRTFRRMSKQVKKWKLKRAEPDYMMEVDEKMILTSTDALKQFWKDYLALRRRGHIVDFKITAPK